MLVWWCSNCDEVYEMEGKAMKPECPDCGDTFIIASGTAEEIEEITKIKKEEWIDV